MGNAKETIEDTTKTLIQTLANIGVTWEDEAELIDLLNCHVNGVIKEIATDKMEQGVNNVVTQRESVITGMQTKSKKKKYGRPLTKTL